MPCQAALTLPCLVLQTENCPPTAAEPRHGLTSNRPSPTSRSSSWLRCVACRCLASPHSSCSQGNVRGPAAQAGAAMQRWLARVLAGPWARGAAGVQVALAANAARLPPSEQPLTVRWTPSTTPRRCWTAGSRAASGGRHAKRAATALQASQAVRRHLQESHQVPPLLRVWRRLLEPPAGGDGTSKRRTNRKQQSQGRRQVLWRHHQAAGLTRGRAAGQRAPEELWEEVSVLVERHEHLYVVEEHEGGEGGKGGVVQHARQHHVLEVSHPARHSTAQHGPALVYKCNRSGSIMRQHQVL